MEVVAVQIKDTKKMATTLQKIAKAITAFPGGEIAFKKSNYQPNLQTINSSKHCSKSSSIHCSNI